MQVEAFTKDEDNDKIVRIKKVITKELNCRKGDTITLEGKNNRMSIAVIAYDQSELEHGKIRIGKTLRATLKVKIGGKEHETYVEYLFFLHAKILSL